MFAVRLLPLRGALVALLAVVCFETHAASQAPVAGRDWQKYPAIAEVDTQEDVYALGDIHGDYERLLTMLLAAKIIPAEPGLPDKVQWKAGKSVLVCTGDFIDKWDQSLRVIALLRALQPAAEKAGGRVIITLGNHEAEFLGDPRIKKAAEFVKELEAKKLKAEDVAAGTDGAGIGRWLRALPVAARVNEWFFVHAGNTHNLTLPQLRDELQRGLDQHGYKAPVLQDLDSLILARMQPRPWWEKEGDSAAQSKERLEKSVFALGVKHLVIGHAPMDFTFADKTTRRRGTLEQHFDGLIFFIDVGMSRAVAYSTGAMLSLHRQNGTMAASRILASGKVEPIWHGQ